MNQNFSRLLRGIFAALDLLVLNIVFFTSMYFFSGIIAPGASKEYYYFAFFSSACWLGTAWLHSIYQPQHTATFEGFVKQTIRAYFLFLIGALLYLYFTHNLEISRLFTVIFLAGFTGGLLVNRMAYLLIHLYFKKRNYMFKRILIIGYNDIARKLALYLEKQNLNLQIVGYCEDEENITELSNYPILGKPVNSLQTAEAHGVNEIYSTILPEQDPSIYVLMEQADRACIRFKLVPDLEFFVKRPMRVNYLGDMPVLSPRTEPLDDLANRIKKKGFDIALSLFAIIFFLSWLIPIISLLIWLESRGPIFFVQKRSGFNNEPFSCIKFRSMRVNKDANLKQATKNDDRFTRVGRILRKTNLDELPQFFNVLRGNMSIVGPRPHMLKHTTDYSEMYDQYMVRQFLKPGITGWAQVHGHRGEITSIDDIRNRVEHDLWYMENWTEWLDFRIIFLTVYNMIRGDRNAY